MDGHATVAGDKQESDNDNRHDGICCVAKKCANLLTLNISGVNLCQFTTNKACMVSIYIVPQLIPYTAQIQHGVSVSSSGSGFHFPTKSFHSDR